MIINPYIFGSLGTGTTWNPSDKDSAITLSNSNRTATTSTAAHRMVRGAAGHSSGKFYYEVVMNNDDSGFGSYLIGVARSTAALNSYCGADAHGFGWQCSATSPQRWNAALNNTYGALCDPGLGAVVGIAVDLDADSIEWFKNNVSQGVVFSGGLTGTLYPAVSIYASPNPAGVTANFLTADFVYTPPSGYGQW